MKKLVPFGRYRIQDLEFYYGERALAYVYTGKKVSHNLLNATYDEITIYLK